MPLANKCMPSACAFPCAPTTGTVKELMDGKALKRPSTVAGIDDTFKKAPKAKAKGHEQAALGI